MSAPRRSHASDTTVSSADVRPPAGSGATRHPAARESNYERALRLVTLLRDADMRRSDSRRLADELACAVANTNDRQAKAWLDAYLERVDQEAQR